MGKSGSSTPTPPPKAPPPPAEDVTAEVIAPTMRQEAARRQRAGAYVTKGQKIGAGGQLLGASPIQLANVRAAVEAGKSTPIAEAKTIDEFQKLKTYGGKSGAIKTAGAIFLRRSAYEKYLKQRQKDIAARSNKPISPEGGMII
jgi:hypothetical protein